MSIISIDLSCPCQSGQSYQACCQPLHQQKSIAQTAEQLMRSRYAAYALQKIDYLVATTVPAQQPHLNTAAMQQWAQQTQWAGLEIVQYLPKVGKIHAQVEFKAFYQTTAGRQAHHELSTFVLISQHWYFLDPTLGQYPSMKQPCLCGSGKKFKQCCAPFLI
ncbi:YchJ family protein [Testudinibacter sp. TR-2022]|uniref:YchJ family protein n=1 Tax=Testudinibacter sp. TR-2022 TaxID=2585029 RepID=UPI001119887E|nr:YchJ family protein [Pasteurellaceae bacterium Phil31]TNH11886.1 YchJ family protein [Testudinibacter sp. TR-2022]TNH12583.1 YchJ family protein [Testudinibacter sp. TR-2022]TNH16141.1 YchJ family protein [Testudinibacter sp. TR-2022]TNH18234.1 YchJ family protein [Testudinibacter sp. TR-2022]